MQVSYSSQFRARHQEVAAEEKRLKALRMIYELKFTFGMEELARAFLNEYVSQQPVPEGAAAGESMTDRVLHRF
jgi:hypothetical protein